MLLIASSLVFGNIVYDINEFMKIVNELPILFAIFADASVPDFINAKMSYNTNITFGYTCNYKQLSTSQIAVCDGTNIRSHFGTYYYDKVFSYGIKYYDQKERKCIQLQ